MTSVRPRVEPARPPALEHGRAPLEGRAGRSAIALRRIPLTISVVVGLWALGLATGSLRDGPSSGLLAAVGEGLDPLRVGHWWSPLTSMLWCPNLMAYLITTGLVVVLVPLAERRLGSGRSAVVLLVVQVLGAPAGVGLVALIGVGGGRWAEQLTASIAVGPAGAVVGLALVTSARMSALWRRRLRLVLVIALVMLALYSGMLSDVLRLATGLVGLVLGMLVLGRQRAVRGPSRPETRVLLALVVAASALGPLIAALSETRIGPLSVLRFVFASPPPDPLTVQQICTDPAAVDECVDLQARLRLGGAGPAIMSVMPVMLLLIAAEGLRRGRRAAWLAALTVNLAVTALGVLLAVSTVATAANQRIVLGAGSHLHSWLAFVLPVLQPLVVVALLVLARAQFAVRAPVGTYRRWALLSGATFLIVSTVYVLGGLLLAAEFDRPPGVLDLVVDLPTRFLPPGYLGEVEPAFLPVGWGATVLYEWTGVLFWVVVALAALLTFARSRSFIEDTGRMRVRRLLAEVGGSSLSYMTTWPGHAYWFTPDGTAAIAYRVIGGVAITTGDPVGPVAARERALHGFVEHCHRRGCTPCLYSVSAEVAHAARAMGWHTVQVAEETLLPLTQLQFTGPKWQDVRTALHRAHKANVLAEWCQYRHAPRAITDQIRAISEEWIAEKGLPEMGFTLGGLDELADDEVRLLIAVDTDRTVHGVTSWLPVRRDGEVVGWTLDFMRRRTDGLHGVMEFLIASAALRCQDEGAELLSLSGAPLARLDRGEPVVGLQRALDLAGRALEPAYGFRSLLAFKAKFQPTYRPLYLAYPEPAALPAIGSAIGRAYLPHLTPRQATRLARRLAHPRKTAN